MKKAPSPKPPSAKTCRNVILYNGRDLKIKEGFRRRLSLVQQTLTAPRCYNRLTERLKLYYNLQKVLAIFSGMEYTVTITKQQRS